MAGPVPSVLAIARTRGRRRPRGFLERTTASFVEALEHALYREELARAPGFFERLDPRLKVPAILGLIIDAATARNLRTVLGLFWLSLLLAIASRAPLRALAHQVWIAVLAFTGVIALPALFLTPGQVVYRLPALGWPVTLQGLTSAAYLVSRVETAATLSALLVWTTPWNHLLKALRVLRVPVAMVVILGMTYRYIFLLLHAARDMLESRRSRLVGWLDGPQRRRVAAASVGVLMSKSSDLSGDVYLAMQSRGFRGEVYILDEFRMRPLDWVMLAVFATLIAAGFWAGR